MGALSAWEGARIKVGRT